MDWDALVDAALDARTRAFAPYSRYPVGAALRAADGRVFTGANTEFGIPALGVCAERAAVIQALTSGVRDFVALVVVTGSSPPAAPCGLCRQTLTEVVGNDLPILLANMDGERHETRLSELIPRPFRFQPRA
jgi:cytidine deaminase